MSDMKHPFCVHVCMKNKVVDSHDNVGKENPSGEVGWDAWERMSASTLRPLTDTSHCGIRSLRVKLMRNCTAHSRAYGYISLTIREAGLDCGLNCHRLEGRRQRLLITCLHARKLKEVFTSVSSLENFNNEILLKSVIFFFFFFFSCYCCLFDCHFPTSICREFS